MGGTGEPGEFFGLWECWGDDEVPIQTFSYLKYFLAGWLCWCLRVQGDRRGDIYFFVSRELISVLGIDFTKNKGKALMCIKRLPKIMASGSGGGNCSHLGPCANGVNMLSLGFLPCYWKQLWQPRQLGGLWEMIHAKYLGHSRCRNMQVPQLPFKNMHK